MESTGHMIIQYMYDPDRFIDPFIDSFARMHREGFVRETPPLPRMDDIETLERMLMQLFFPGHQGTETPQKLRRVIQYLMESTMHLLCDSIALALRYSREGMSEEESNAEAERLSDRIGEALPGIRRILKTDAAAGYEGDPASMSVHEVILCYPYMEAMASNLIVLSKKANYLNDIIIDGVSGFYFESNRDFFDKLNIIMNLSQEEADKIRKVAKDKISIYSSEKFYENIMKVYKRAIRDRW